MISRYPSYFWDYTVSPNFNVKLVQICKFGPPRETKRRRARVRHLKRPGINQGTMVSFNINSTPCFLKGKSIAEAITSPLHREDSF